VEQLRNADQPPAEACATLSFWAGLQRHFFGATGGPGAVDRQKLTPIWSRFGLNNVSARFHHIWVISQPESWRSFPPLRADMCRGERAVGAVGTARFRDCISLADANCGARCGFGIRRFDSNFLTKLCISFGSTADFSARPTSLLGTFVYRIQRNAHRPITAAANRRPRATAKSATAKSYATAKCYEE
jgi:hypothetical protein